MSSSKTSSVEESVPDARQCTAFHSLCGVSLNDEIPWGPCRISWPSAQPMYAAARRWRDEALVSDQSLFGGHPIDGLQAADELVEFYVNNPDVGSGTFVAKLKTQLEGVSDAGVQVAAELLYFHTLVVSTASWSARSKAELINSVTGFRSIGVAAMSSKLEAVLSGGAAGPGQAYLNYRWKMFAYLIGVFAHDQAAPYQ